MGLELDPGNQFLWRANRKQLDLEPMRDSILSMGRLLNHSRPESSQVALIGEGEVGRGINEKPLTEPFYHRAIFLPVLRTAMLDIHKVFDLPDPSNLQGSRNASNVPTQSLFFLNNDLVIQAARGLAERVSQYEASPAQQIQLIFLHILNRPASPDELAATSEFIARVGADTGREKAMTLACQSLMASAEFRFIH